MESQLTVAERYTYGNRSRIKSSYGNAEGETDGERLRNELLIASPNRQRAMINLAERQIKTQEKMAQEIVASNIAGAEMVSSQISQQTQEMRFEIQQQTSQLQSTFESVGSSISNSVYAAADQVSDSIESVGARISESVYSSANQVSKSIDNLGNRLSVELSEIYWQNVQQNQTLEKILTVLQENRNNEARQLVSQGLRLYINNQYEKAEERFLRALDYDMTDYQVLMNLGYIEINKENIDAAFSYFQDALSLPENLDVHSKSRTLWAISRLHYTQGNYQKALLYAAESLKIDAILIKYNISQSIKKKNDQISVSYTCLKHTFILGVYAALSGNKEQALMFIKRAIILEPEFFTLAAVEPDLECIRKDVLELLAKMSVESFEEATNKMQEVQEIIDKLNHYKGKIKDSDFFPQLIRSFDKVKKILQKPTYFNCIQCITKLFDLKQLASDSLESIRQATDKIQEIQPLISELKSHPANKNCSDFISEVEQTFSQAQTLLEKPSYEKNRKCIKSLYKTKRLCETGNRILSTIDLDANNLDKLMQEKIVLEKRLASQDLQIKEAQKNLVNFKSQINFVRIVGFGILAIIGINIIIYHTQQSGATGAFLSTIMVACLGVIPVGIWLGISYTITKIGEESFQKRIDEKTSKYYTVEKELQETKQNINKNQNQIQNLLNELNSSLKD